MKCAKTVKTVKKNANVSCQNNLKIDCDCVEKLADLQRPRKTKFQQEINRNFTNLEEKIKRINNEKDSSVRTKILQI